MPNVTFEMPNAQCQMPNVMRADLKRKLQPSTRQVNGANIGEAGSRLEVRRRGKYQSFVT